MTFTEEPPVQMLFTAAVKLLQLQLITCIHAATAKTPSRKMTHIYRFLIGYLKDL